MYCIRFPKASSQQVTPTTTGISNFVVFCGNNLQNSPSHVSQPPSSPLPWLWDLNSQSPVAASHDFLFHRGRDWVQASQSPCDHQLPEDLGSHLFLQKTGSLSDAEQCFPVDSSPPATPLLSRWDRESISFPQWFLVMQLCGYSTDHCWNRPLGLPSELKTERPRLKTQDCQVSLFRPSPGWNNTDP